LPAAGALPAFINADLIAAGIAPLAADSAAMQAGRLMLSLIDGCVQARQDFAFETTLSSRNYARQIPIWQSLGYHVGMCFLTLPNAETAIERVKKCVAQGGHSIPEDVVRRRFASGRANFDNVNKPLVNSWVLLDAFQPVPTVFDRGAQ
jgi:predicted ABC-type ATPase